MTGRVLIIVDGPAALNYATELVAQLRRSGASVVVAPTGYAGPSALSFVTELSWTTLAGHPCKAIENLGTDDFRQQDLILLAPVSEQVLGVFLRGKALAALQEAGKPVIAVVPHLPGEETAPETSALFRKLMPQGSLLLESTQSLVLGAMGELRSPALETILLLAEKALARKDYAGKRLLVTAGPTIEDIDPVRFLTNRSSGKMGVAIAVDAALRGADVQLVHGPLQCPLPTALEGLHDIPVRSAEEMHAAVMARWRGLDVAVLAAAVADFRPDHCAPQKIKKIDGQSLILNLRRTPDILAQLGEFQERPFLVGFAAESDDVEANALIKLRKKHCDLICANDIRKEGCGFAGDTNQITIYAPGKPPLHLPMKSKKALAHDILNEVKSCLTK